MTQPTDRPGIDDLTSDGLDALYGERDLSRSLLAKVRETSAQLINREQLRADRAEATLAAVRKLHAPVNHRGRTICGHCSGYGGGSCDNGPQGHPCPTIAVLDQYGQTPA